MAHIVIENGETFLRDDWGVEDVRNVIEYNDIEGTQDFTDEDCVRVLELVADMADANIGISWAVLECAIAHHLQGEKK